MYVRELTVKYRLRRVRHVPWASNQFRSPSETTPLLTALLGNESVEVCGVLCLSTRFELLGYHELSRGTIDAAMVHPRDVFRTALLAHAHCLIVAHNHPSGDPTPSPDDIALTHRLKAAGDLLGVQLVDHVIVTLGGRYYSFQEFGLL